MTKGSALHLALVPPLAVLLTRRFQVVRHPWFWIPALAVAIVCGPYTWKTLDMARSGWAYGRPAMAFVEEAARYYPVQLARTLGGGLSVLAAVGLVDRLLRPLVSGNADTRWASIGALAIGVLLFQLFVPCGLETRHLLPAVPALMMFCAAGVSPIAGLLPRRKLTPRWRVASVLLVVVAGFFLQRFTVQSRPFHGFRPIARELLGSSELRDAVFLISSDAVGEGMFVSEVAMQEKRPGHFVLRASKALSRSRWDESDYQSLFHTTAEVMKYLSSVPVRIVVLDLSADPAGVLAHHSLLEETIRVYPERWETLGAHPVVRSGLGYRDAVRVFRLKGGRDLPRAPIEVDMRDTLKRTLRR